MSNKDMKNDKGKNQFGIALPIILISYFMILLDNSIVFTSTVKIANDLGLDSRTLAWVTNAYVLTFGGFLLFGGRAGDIWGRKKIFILGLIIFSIGSLFVGLAQNASVMITTRALQGIGSAILAPTTLSLLMDNYVGVTRTRAISYYGATAGLGAAFGLVLGGIITSYLSWRVGFFMNLPIGLALVILTIRYIKPSKTKKTKLDWMGIILSVIGVSALVYSINGINYCKTALFFAIVFLAFFVARERRCTYSIMPMRLFFDRERLSAYIARFFYAGAILSYFFLAPQAMQNVYGFSPFSAAVGFLPETIPQFLSAMVVARLSSRVDNKKILFAGIMVTLFGLIIGAQIGVQHGYFFSIAVPMILIGIGQGMSVGPLTVSGVANTEPEIAGAASGVVNTIHQIGSSVGLSAVVALTSGIQPEISFDRAMVIMSGFMVVALLATVNIIRKNS